MGGSGEDLILQNRIRFSLNPDSALLVSFVVGLEVNFFSPRDKLNFDWLFRIGLEPMSIAMLLDLFFGWCNNAIWC